MYLSFVQFRMSIKTLLSALLDGDGLTFNPVFRPLLRTTHPRPGLAMQRVPCPRINHPFMGER
jgi:hypothetical protein